MLNDILTGKASNEDQERKEQDPFRAPGAVATISCSTCGATAAADPALGTRCYACVHGAAAARRHELQRQQALFDAEAQVAILEGQRQYENAVRGGTSGGGSIASGIALLVLGILVTSTTYSSASQEGGTYLVAYGPILAGIILIVRGLARGS